MAYWQWFLLQPALQRLQLTSQVGSALQFCRYKASSEDLGLGLAAHAMPSTLFLAILKQQSERYMCDHSVWKRSQRCNVQGGSECTRTDDGLIGFVGQVQSQTWPTVHLHYIANSQEYSDVRGTIELMTRMCWLCAGIPSCGSVGLLYVLEEVDSTATRFMIVDTLLGEGIVME